MKGASIRLLLTSIVFLAIHLELSGCITGTHESSVREVPTEAKIKISKGDTKEKVHAILGEPLIDAHKYNMEVYRESGHDIDVLIWIPPMPFPGDKVVAVFMILYDNLGKVKEIQSEIMIKESALDHTTFSLHAGGLQFANLLYEEPNTLFGPIMTWDEFTDPSYLNKDMCTLKFVMDNCPMEKIFINGKKIVRLKNYDAYCPLIHQPFKDDEPFYINTDTDKISYLEVNLPPGNQHVKVKQSYCNGEFEAKFECAAHEQYYIRIDAVRQSNFWTCKYDGELFVSKHLSKNTPISTFHLDKMIRRILWHDGKWYGP